MKREYFLPLSLLAVMVAMPVHALEQHNCRLERYSQIPITTLPDGRFTVPILIEGKSFDALVDTGGAVATLGSEQAHSLHLNLNYSSTYLEGVAGQTMVRYAVVKNFSLGRLEGGSLDFYIDPNLPPGVDGTLAPDMLKRYDVDVDLMRGTLSLFSPKHCPGQVVYWTNAPYVVLPMQVEYGAHIKVPVTVDGLKFEALLDTGADHAIISMSAARLLGISEASPDLKLVGGKDAKYKEYDYPFKQLDFDGIVVTRPRIQIVSDGFLPGRNIDLIVGISILRRLHLYIAYGEEKLYITPASAN